MRQIQYLLLLSLLCVSGSLYALDKDEQDLPGLPSGAYDYLVYAVTWQPTFCLLNPTAPGCKAYRADFYTHGIWPYFLSTERSANRHPSHCIQSPGCPTGSSCTLLPEVIDTLLQDTAFRKIVSAQPEGLMKHEWSKHGTCLGSGQREYFTRFTQLRSAVKYDDEFKSIWDSPSLCTPCAPGSPITFAFAAQPTAAGTISLKRFTCWTGRAHPMAATPRCR
ncbi:hypothetical protein O0544_12580 [Edwardsiella anguillarum]|nr:hypothetical protein [Edwardsiella anguillarum]